MLLNNRLNSLSVAKLRLDFKISTLSFDVIEINLNRYSIMRKSILISLIFLALSYTLADAKSGYDYYHYGNNNSSYNKLNKTSIMKIAKVEVRRLAMEKKLPKSWKSVAVFGIEKSDIESWTVTFKNLKIKTASRQTLYIFVDVYGKVQGTNYTGR